MVVPAVAEVAVVVRVLVRGAVGVVLCVGTVRSLLRVSTAEEDG